MSRTRVKICGLTRPEDAELAAALGADAIGVIFAESPRRVSPEQAVEVLEVVPPFVTRVGVFANQELSFILEVVRRCRIDWVQLSGQEPASLARQLPTRVLKAVHVRSAADLHAASDYPADAFLLDAPPLGRQMGGTGRTFDWEQLGALPWPHHRVIAAGGLTPDNVGTLIARLRPGGVDVSSGVEAAPGIKDPARLEAFFAAVERAGPPSPGRTAPPPPILGEGSTTEPARGTDQSPLSRLRERGLGGEGPGSPTQRN